MAKKDAKPFRSKLPPEEYLKILKDVVLSDIWLSNIEATRAKSIPEGPLSVEFSLEPKQSTHQNEYLELELKFAFEAILDEQGEPMVQIDATYVLRFESKKEVSREFLDIFERTVAQMVTWPYCRELVQTVIAKMGLPPYTLPLVMTSEVKFDDSSG